MYRVARSNVTRFGVPLSAPLLGSKSAMTTPPMRSDMYAMRSPRGDQTTCSGRSAVGTSGLKVPPVTGAITTVLSVAVCDSAAIHLPSGESAGSSRRPV